MDEGLYLAVLHILGFDYAPKPAASVIFIEIHKQFNKHVVRFLYSNKYIESLACGLECSTEDFVAHIESKKLRYNTKSACEMIEEPNDNINLKYFLAIGLLFIMILLAKYWNKFNDWAKNKTE